MDIATRRLRGQRLAGNPLDTADEVVGWLGAVQAQDYPAAVWALGQRTRDATAADVRRLFDVGAIVRTHLLRPTWHLVLPADVRWLLALTAPRLRTASAGRWRALGIDPGVMSRAEGAFAGALAGGRRLTRTELGAVLRAAGIAPDGQRLSHLIMAAELDALVVSGPRHGHDFTYMLMDDRVPVTAPLRPEEALGRLAERYFRSRGPAQLLDFAWGAGTTLDGARGGVAAAGDKLASEVIDGKRYWFGDPVADAVPVPAGAAAPTPGPGLLPPKTPRAPLAHLPPELRRTDRGVPRSLRRRPSRRAVRSRPLRLRQHPQPGSGAPGAGWCAPVRCACRCACSTRCAPVSGPLWTAPATG
jgi:hypothetical protein